VATLEGEVEALRRALNDTQSRHADQLARWGNRPASIRFRARHCACQCMAISTDGPHIVKSHPHNW
jgi:hypothetical protein